MAETHTKNAKAAPTDKVQGLDFGGGWNGELVLGGDGEGSVAVAKLSQDVDLRHVVPDGLHELQVRRFNSLGSRRETSC